MESNREFSDDWDFLNSNDLSVEDFWMVLYFQTLPYDEVFSLILTWIFLTHELLMASLGSLDTLQLFGGCFDDLLFGIQRYF
ncbi:unnamed protein product [Rhizophagus irregularis]|nr:unnamed protein product [Rhizophagus irregularis]